MTGIRVETGVIAADGIQRVFDHLERNPRRLRAGRPARADRPRLQRRHPGRRDSAGGAMR